MLLLYSLSVLISVTMSLPEECHSFKDPSSPIGRVQSGLSASILFESGKNRQANLTNNNINKGKWTQEEHKIFMQEYEKYGNNCMQIAKVLSTRTPAQIKKLWRYYALAVVGTSRYLLRQKRSISTKTQVEPTIGHLFRCRLSLGPKSFFARRLL